MCAVSFDQKDYRRALGGFATGVTIVTVFDTEGQPWGLTANSFTSVSLEPPLISVCVSKQGRVFPVISKADRFAVNVLSHEQKDLAMLFAGKSDDRFSGIEWFTTDKSAPLLPDVSLHLDCTVYQRIDAGDHEIILGHVERYDQSPAVPLVYCRGQFFKAHETEA